MAHLVRAASRGATLSSLRRRTILGIGALAAAGLATFAQRHNFGCTRLVTPTASYISRLHFTQNRSFASLFSSISDSAAMSSLTPPQPAPSWTHSPEDVTRITKETIDKDRKLMDEIAAIKESDCTLENVCRIWHYYFI